MAEPLATVDRLAARVGEAIETAEDTALAEEMLEAASAEVRFYGLEWPTAAEAPAVAVNIVLAAAARGYMNPGGFSRERSDAATFDRGDIYSMGVELTGAEKDRLKSFSGRGGVRSVAISNPDSWASRSDSGRSSELSFMRYDFAFYSEKQLLTDMGYLG